MILKFRPAFLVWDGHPLVNLLGWGVYSSGVPLAGSAFEEAAHFLLGRRSFSIFQTIALSRHLPAVPLLKFLARFRLPDRLLFLTVSPQAAMERIRKRGEALQAHETSASLERLQEAYREALSFLQSSYNLPVTVLDTSGRNAEDVAAEAQRWALS